VKIKPYEETHMDGIISLENNPIDLSGNPPLREWPIVVTGDLGIQIAEDGRVWICINGVSFLRFKPSGKYCTQGSKLKGGDR
jgi:hypothetical protein